ncbi:MAG: tRNA dihydrouridine synthase DusB [Eubacterium sp.]|nr:tRNA dihydrouridine synthase DusB [Eubacterium sp.]MDD7208514.1 tRNA dihydrouridine synthase DusB [Lachnospiraceae bacterium]MDY5498195.1 tRNA dihydrouridine synthase DusB [Anaerobutyricum sp.]
MTVKEIYGTDFPVILAPMAGITDLPFRLLCKEQGADVMVTEMVSAKALYYGNKNTEPLLQTREEEKPIGLQIFGSEPELMGQMAHRMEDKGFAFIDINMGCPVPKIVNNKEGSALMLTPELAGRIVKEVSCAVHLPVTVKFRKGFDDDHVNAPEFARIMEESGAAAVAVHGRTRMQYYSGEADWDIIREVKKAVSIPVIGNGDIFCGTDAVRMKEYTGCDGVMVARGAKGNPWIFRDIKAALAGEEIPKAPSREEILTMMLRHAALSVEVKGEKMGIREMRKHTAWYTTGMRGSASLRNAVNKVETLQEFSDLIMR